MKYKKSASVFCRFFLPVILFLAGCHAEISKEQVPENVNAPAEEQKIPADSNFAKGILNRDIVMKSAAEVTSKVYPNADDVMVDDYIFTTYKKDGTSITWDDTFIKILTEKGKRSNQTLAFYFSLPYSTVKLKILEIIKPDGKVVPVDIALNSKVMINSSQMNQNIYNPNDKILKVSIPSLEIGDTVRYMTCRDTVKPRVADTWSDRFLFEYTSPIKHTTVEILAPSELPLTNIEIRDPVKGTVSSDVKKLKDGTRYRWVVKDVPRMFREPNMPALDSVVQRLLVSTIKSWKELSEWYWKLSRPHLEKITPAMRKKVAELTANTGSDQRKIEAIFHFVSQKIRYMGITTEKEAPGYEPHDVNITFENKYGVCRDKAALLTAMLRIAGFKAYPVLIMVGPKQDPDVPNPYFNHAIACVEKQNGEYMLMDPTDESTRGLFPAYLCNRSYLVAKPDGETLRTSRIIPATDNLMHIITHATVNDAGVMIAETALRFSGINDGAYRGYFARRNPAERKQFFEKIITSVFPGAKLVEYDIQPEDIQKTSQGLKVYLRYVAENTFIKGDGKVIVPSPLLGNSIGIVNFIIGRTGLEKRKYPLVTDIACGVREKFSIDFKNALGVNIALPNSPPVDTETVRWNRNMSLDNKILSGNSEFMLKVVEFSPKEYTELKDVLKLIEYDKRKSAIFYEPGVVKVSGNMVSSNADIVVLDDTVNYKIIDSSTWEQARTVREKILSYAGKKQFSELKFQYNPAWENITVEYAKVIQKDGTVKKVSKDEIHLMDAGWVGSAPRYPPSKILVINLPGVEVGAVIEYRVVHKYRDRPFFSMTEYFQGFNPVMRKTVRLQAPKTMPLKISNLNRAGNILFTYKDDKKGNYVWEGSDANALKREKNLPPSWSFIPSCAVSSGDWELYSTLISKTLQDAAGNKGSIQTLTHKLTGKIKDPLKKVEAIRNFVALNIRDAGPAFSELPLSAISSPETTLKDGYGNSADRAVLLYAMLKKAGFYPDFLLVADYPRIDQLRRLDHAPQNNIFNKVLVRIVYRKQNIYLNDTDQYAALGTTPSENRTALFCATNRMGKVVVDPDKETRTDIAYTLRIDEKGRAVIIRKRTFSGTDNNYWKKRYSEMTEEERSRHFQELTASVSQSAVPTGNLKTDFTKYPGTEEFSVSVANFAVVEKNKYLYLKLPGSLKNVLDTYGNLRTNPFLFSSSEKSTISYLLNLPSAYAARIPIAPSSNTWELPSDAGTITIVNDRDIFGATAKPVIFINQDIDIKPAMIPKADFEEVQLISSKISNQKTQTLLMEKTVEKKK